MNSYFNIIPNDIYVSTTYKRCISKSSCIHHIPFSTVVKWWIIGLTSYFNISTHFHILSYWFKDSFYISTIQEDLNKNYSVKVDYLWRCLSFAWITIMVNFILSITISVNIWSCNIEPLLSTIQIFKFSSLFIVLNTGRTKWIFKFN